MVNTHLSITPDHYVPTFRINGQARAGYFGDWRRIENGPWGNVPIVPILPYPNEALPATASLSVLFISFRRAPSECGCCNDFFSFRKESYITCAESCSDSCLRAGNNPLRSRISIVCAVENQNGMVRDDGHDVIRWIHFYPYRPVQFRVGTVQDADWLHIATGVAAKHKDRIGGERRCEYFTVDGIHSHVIGSIQQRLRPLNNPNGRFVAVGAAAEKQNRLSKGIGNREFIMDRIHSDIVARTRLKRFCTLNHSGGKSISVRQTGVYRDSRLAHSVGSQYFFPLWVVGDSAYPSHTGQGSAFRRSADHAQRGYVPVRRSREHTSYVAIPTRYP